MVDCLELAQMSLLRALILMPAVDENRWMLPLLLSFTAGYVDTAGFLALQGLFTAHVTGNFVTLGASLAWVRPEPSRSFWRFPYSA